MLICLSLTAKEGVMYYWKIIIVLLILVIGGCREERKQPDRFTYFRNYSRTFNDMNDRHVKAARRWGIEPVGSSQELKKMKGKLELVKSCRLYEVDKLTHSHPYLIPRAHQLLKNIARNFKDSLESKHLPSYNVVVTSVLRTNESVKRLRRRNLNASANSAHMFGTTFDIAYTRFRKNNYKEAPAEKLKSVLAEVLCELRKQKQCYVRYEYKQGCFHITVR